MSRLKIQDLTLSQGIITVLPVDIQNSVFGGTELVDESHSFGRDRYYYDTDGDGKWDYKVVRNSRTGDEIKTKLRLYYKRYVWYLRWSIRPKF